MRYQSDGVATKLEPAPAPEDQVTERVPLVKADAAMLSLRSSGHDFPSAAGEVIDNSLEAGANAVKVRTFASKKKVGKNTNATEVIERVAIGDDGEGMDLTVLHHALQMGYSSRYNSRIGLGRFGVGAKLGGISQAQRIEVFSRQGPDSPWLWTYIDLEEIQGGQDEIPLPVPAELPEDCTDLAGPEHGTLVIWSKTDRLQERETGGARLASHLEKDLITYISRTFRKFLDGGKQIWVNELPIKPHDPTFLMTSTRFHQIAEKTTLKIPNFPRTFKFPRAVADKVFYDSKTKLLTYKGVMSEQQRQQLLALAEREDFTAAVEEQLGRKPTSQELSEQSAAFKYAIEDLFDRSNPDPVATVLHSNSFEFPIPGKPGQTSSVEVTVTLLPEKFWQREKFKDRPGGAPRNVERRIDENEGISILRAGREIFYGPLPRVQPKVREEDRFIGIEIRFRPELDECFKVRNVKKGAEPVEGLRDKLRDEIFSTVKTGRNQLHSRYATLKAKEQRDSGIHAEAEQVVQQAKDISPKPRAGENMPEPERKRRIEEAADVLTRDDPGKRKDAVEAITSRPLSIVPRAWPGGEFLQIEHLGGNAIVYLNTQHPFYAEVYSKLVNAMDPGAEVNIPALARLIQVGLDLLLLSYAQAEGVEKDADEKYANLRGYWGIHLKTNVQQWARTQPENIRDSQEFPAAADQPPPEPEA